MEYKNKYQEQMERKIKKLEARQAKREERKRKKFEKKSSSKLKRTDTALYKFLVRVVPISSIVFLGLSSIKYILGDVKPEPLNIHFNIFSWEIIDLYIDTNYIFIVLFVFLAIIMLLGILTLGYLSNGSKATKFANNIGKASKTYSPTFIKIIKFSILGIFFSILWILPIITNLYGEVILNIVYTSFYCYLVGASSSTMGEFIYQHKLRKIEKNIQDAEHIDRMNTYDLVN